MLRRLGLSVIVVALAGTAVAAGGSGGARVQQATTDMAVRAAAPLLADWIAAARAEAAALGVLSPPPVIAAQLRGFFPDPLLQTVRYRIGWAKAWTLHGSAFRLFDARAIALGDVIVFRDAAIAADPVIWAHELTHVRQYRRWGVRGFAETYIRSRDTVETEAWEAAADYTMWALQHGASPAGVGAEVRR